MRILVTGHLGYLGRQFTERYGNDFDIVGFDIAEGDDVLDLEALTERARGCEQVVHLAAIPKPVEGRSLDEYLETNVQGTHNAVKAALAAGCRRVIVASSTTYYGVEQGIPFRVPIQEGQPGLSQYVHADQLSCREVDLSYHTSKKIMEEILAWYGLNKKIETVALRLAPIGKVFLGTSVSDENAAQAIQRALACPAELWYEAFNITDDLPHVDTSKAKRLLGYRPAPVEYRAEQVHSALPGHSSVPGTPGLA